MNPRRFVDCYHDQSTDNYVCVGAMRDAMRERINQYALQPRD